MTLADVQRLLERPVGSLSQLDLSRCVPGASEVIALLLVSGHLPHLKSLDLTATPVGKSLADLVKDPACSRLETLLLGGVSGDALGVSMRHGTKWAAMVTSDLEDEGLAAIASSPHLANLRQLDVSYAVAKPETWERFAASALVTQLTHFGAAMTPDWPEGSLHRFLARAAKLEGLGLSCSHVGDAGAQVLVTSNQALRRLEIGLCHLTLVGACTLLEAPFPKLEWIDFRGVPMTEAFLSALTKRSGTRALKAVVLDEQTSMPTGERDLWYDQGAIVGESEGLFWLWQLDQKPFVEAGLKVIESPMPWPRGWLA